MALAASLVAAATAQVPGVAGVQGGMRFTFYAASASVVGTRQQAVLKPGCDPAEENCWTDPATGQTIGQQDVPSSSGQGLVVMDVVYLDAQTCVVRLWLYTLDPTTGAVLSGASSGEVTTGGSCLDYWVNPASLQQLADPNSPTHRVIRGTRPIGNGTFQAVTIAASTNAGYQNNTYDAVTGLLVVASSRTQGANVATIAPGNVLTTGAGNAMLTYTELRGARPAPFVAAAEPLPDYVLNANLLTYTCTQATVVAGAGGVQFPCQFETRLGERTAYWVKTTSYLSLYEPVANSNVSQSGNLIASTGPGSYWASPAALADLRAGTVIDQDPVTGIRTSVPYVDDDVVQVVEESNAERKTSFYDRRTGWLLRLVLEQRLGLGITTTQVDLVGVE